MKRICFVSIFDLTVLYEQLAQHLSLRGHQIYWMTTNPEWTNWLVAQGTDRKRILELVFSSDTFLTGSDRTTALVLAGETERAASRTISSAMLADQFVMDRPAAHTGEVMLLYRDHTAAWLQANSIDLVFAEPTNSNELITNMVCEQLGIPFLFPQTMRIPSNRFFFSKGVQYSSMVYCETDTIRSDEQLISGAEVIRAFREQPERPKYFDLNNSSSVLDTARIRRSLPARLSEAFGNGGSHLTRHRTSERVKLTVRRAVNRTRLEVLTSYPSLDQLQGRFAFFGLHVQPEQSIDVVGPFVSDQVKLIKDIRRSLPFDMTLLVKEHPNALGTKPWHEIDEIRRIPGVTLIDHRISTFELYHRVELVFTVSGTTAFESALLGTPAITFTRLYFGGLSAVYCCEEITQLKKIVEHILLHHQSHDSQDERAMQAMLDHSFAGYWTDPLTDRSVLDPANLSLLKQAFASMVEDGRY